MQPALINQGPFGAWMAAWGIPATQGWRVTSLAHARGGNQLYLPGEAVECWLHFIGRTVVISHLNKFQQGGGLGGLRED